HARADSLRETRLSIVVGGVAAKRRAERGLLCIDALAGLARCQVPIDVRRSRQVELLVQVGVQPVADVRAVHVHDSCACRRYCSRSLRARARRDITVPSGMPAMAAISLYDRPSSSRRTTASRNSSGSRSSAALTSRFASFSCRSWSTGLALRSPLASSSPESKDSSSKGTASMATLLRLSHV